ncbi:DUF4345 domain-containing protein [Roseibium sp. LAB1]
MTNLSRKTALALSALTFLVIGTLIVFAPAVLFSSSGITLSPSAAMMSEVRSPGVLILMACFAASMGLFYRSWEAFGLLVSAALLLGYGAGRLVSLTLDGLPPAPLVAAAAVELGLGCWCAVHLLAGKRKAVLQA